MCIRDSAEGVDDNGRPLTMKAIWRNIQLLIRGRSNFENTSTMRLKRPDGSLSESMEENTEIMRKYLCGVFAKNGTFDPAEVRKVRQRRVRHWMDRPPTEEEILIAVKKMNNWRSGGDAKIPAEFFKALCKGYGSEDATETTNACVAALVSMYQQYWICLLYTSPSPRD